MEVKCIKCGFEGTHNELHVPEGHDLLNEWLCLNCYEKYRVDLNRFNTNYCQPDRSEDHKAIKSIEEIVEEIANDHRKILDDWCKAYLAEIYIKTGKVNPGDFVLIEEEMEWSDATKMRRKYYFMLKEREGTKNGGRCKDGNEVD